MKTILIYLLAFFLVPLFSFAQDYKVESFQIVKDDMTARTNPREDFNGKNCALLKVYVDDKIVEARGNVIGDVEVKGLENGIYLTDNSKQVELVFEKHYPLKVVFNDYNIPSLLSGMTYVLKLKSINNTYAGNSTPNSSNQNTSNSITNSNSNSPKRKGLIENNSSALLTSNYLSKYKNVNDYFTEGADMYNAKRYFPDAYKAFMAYGDLANKQKGVDKNMVATSYFNAGLAASQGGATQESADAFVKAVNNGYTQPEAWIYAIACYQMIAQNEPWREKEAHEAITEIALDGLNKYGINQPIFLNNVVNSYVVNNESDKALSLLNSLISKNPNKSSLYGLRGYVYDRLGRDSESEVDFIKAASFSDADFETLKNASNKLYRVGMDKLNQIEGNSSQANSQRQVIKRDYFEKSRTYAQRANRIQPGDPYIQNILDSLDYALSTFF